MSQPAGGIVLNPKGLIRLITIGGIVATNAVGGGWFWVGFLLAGLMVAGMAGASHRTGLSWIGGVGLLLWALVQVHALESLVGYILVGIAAIGFMTVWMHGPVHARHQSAVPVHLQPPSRRVG